MTKGSDRGDRLSEELAATKILLDQAEARARTLEARLNAEAQTSQHHLSRLRAREDLLESLYRSWSWRSTEPFRRFKNTFLQSLWPKAGTQNGLQLSPRLESPIDIASSCKRIFLECTHTYHSDLNTGIQRVVRNIIRCSPEAARRHNYEIVPVMIEGERFVYADPSVVLKNGAQKKPASRPRPDAFSRAYGVLVTGLARLMPSGTLVRLITAPSGQLGLTEVLLTPFRVTKGFLFGLVSMFRRQKPMHVPSPLDLYASHAGNILVLLDSSWTVPIWPAVKDFSEKGGIVVGVIYDLIPVTHPHTSVENLTIAFREWLSKHFKVTNGFVAISATIANEIKQYGATHNIPRIVSGEVAIGHFRLGCELDLIDTVTPPRDLIRQILGQHSRKYLMVGSIEPRKNHEFVLDSFEKSWVAGGDDILLICGRNAWKTESYLDRVSKHRENGKKLFLIRDATDAELDFCYRNSTALIIPSETEGFGLPIVEALQRELPVICSDIPVFREVAGEHAVYFDLSNRDSLFDLLMDYGAGRKSLEAVDVSALRINTWEQSAAQLIVAVVDTAHRAAADKGHPGGDNPLG